MAPRLTVAAWGSVSVIQTSPQNPTTANPSRLPAERSAGPKSGPADAPALFKSSALGRTTAAIAHALS